jgi:hypothetical protein
LSLRKLVWLAGGRWKHTAAVMAMLANVNRDPKKTPAFTGAEFNPWVPKPRPQVTQVEPKRFVEILAHAMGARRQ